ncbi:hypothetical protein [Kushneria indalinina]|uniref:Uncharacterized protein n=1 Tax=Kushneria indalinina DSM 14324 TaxID=1122140 RepID=A0A3D9E0J7_9GAMM|nr:hypothetical protein [Kushneria indalinina]REC95994.1 hypothetical protein C8D72_0665 [Kushneria indalinina DSM 14324]
MIRQQLAKIRMSRCEDKDKYIEIVVFLDGDRCICEEDSYGHVKDNYGDGLHMYPVLLTPVPDRGAPVFEIEWGGNDRTFTELDFQLKRPVKEGDNVICEESSDNSQDQVKYDYKIKSIEVLLNALPGGESA